MQSCLPIILMVSNRGGLTGSPQIAILKTSATFLKFIFISTAMFFRPASMLETLKSLIFLRVLIDWNIISFAFTSFFIK